MSGSCSSPYEKSFCFQPSASQKFRKSNYILISNILPMLQNLSRNKKKKEKYVTGLPCLPTFLL